MLDCIVLMMSAWLLTTWTPFWSIVLDYADTTMTMWTLTANLQGWVFALSLNRFLLFCSKLLSLKSGHERFTLVACDHDQSLLSLLKKE